MEKKKGPEIIEQAYQINNTFTQIILSEGDVVDITRALARFCDGGVKVVDLDNKILAKTDPFGVLEDKKTGNGDRLVKKEVAFNNEVTAYLYLAKGEKAISELDLLAMESAVTNVAFLLLKKQNGEEVEKSYRHEFLNDLVDGDIGSREEIFERSTFYELEMTKPYILILINIESMDEIFPRQNKKETYKLLRKTFNLAFRTFFSTANDCIVWTRSNNIIVLYPLAPALGEGEDVYQEAIKGYSRDVAGRIKTVIENNIDNINITVGLGRFYGDIFELCKSYKEAVTAVKTGKSVWGNNRIYHYDDLGFYRILQKYPHSGELSYYAKEVLAPLVEYDMQRKTNLVQTLEQLIANCGKQKATADKLFIHTKTLAYRKKKIEEILNISLDDAEAIFNAAMALKIMKVLDLEKG
jgi:PucR family transcriptional regulator, purine catabolism regulatory protein